MYRLNGGSTVSFPESATTRLRRGRLLDFVAGHEGRCSAGQVRACVADRMDGDPASICPKGNLVLTYANAQAEPGRWWLAAPQATGKEEWTAYDL